MLHVGSLSGTYYMYVTMWDMVHVFVSTGKDWSPGYFLLVIVEVCYLFIGNSVLRGLLCIVVSTSELSL